MRRLGRFSARRCLSSALVLLAAPLCSGYASASPVPPAVTGVVTLDGVPVANATVTITALPTPGSDWPDSYRATPLATGRTGVTGQFAIPVTLDASTVSEAVELNGGDVNMWVQAYYNDAQQNADAVDYIVSGGKGTAYRAADLVYISGLNAVSPLDDIASTMAMPDPVTLELMAYQAASQGQTTGGSFAGMLIAPASDPGGGGGEECRSTYAPYVTVVATEIDYQPVGEAHVMYDTTGKFTYGEKANTDLNGAYQLNGGAWDATASTSKISNKAGTLSRGFTAHQAYVVETAFRYRKERIDYTDDYGDGHVCQSDYRIVPERWVGGGQLGADVSSHDSGGQLDAARGKQWATRFTKGFTFDKNTAKGEKYKAGVTAFRVNLFAQSEWSKQVDMHWDFGNDIDDHWLYGSNNDVMSAQNVYAW